MFVGTIPAPVRGIIREIVTGWGKVPVYVGCSGNFTIESAISDLAAEVHSNDVSLYSTAIGSALTGKPLPVTIKSDDHRWLEQYVTTPLDTVTTLVLSLEYLWASFKDGPFFKRTWNAVYSRWPTLHEQTREKVAEAMGKIKVTSYTPQDVVEFVENAPLDCGIMAFPPTYKNGYERMFKPLDAVFAWEAVPYTLFDEDRMAHLIEQLTARRQWVLYWDRDIEGLADNLIGYAQPNPRSHPVRIYASKGETRLVVPHQQLEPLRIPRVNDEPITGPLELVPITQPQLNAVRAQYLGTNIVPAAASYRFAVTVGGKLAGVIAFAMPTMGGSWQDAYLMTDLAVAPTKYARLSKLVLAAALSTEVRDFLSQRMVKDVQIIGTTAFTDKPVSMKYRGLFELHSRKEGRLNYAAKAGKWTLDEALEWWTKKYGTTLKR